MPSTPAFNMPSTPATATRDRELTVDDVRLFLKKKEKTNKRMEAENIKLKNENISHRERIKVLTSEIEICKGVISNHSGALQKDPILKNLLTKWSKEAQEAPAGSNSSQDRKRKCVR